MALSTRRRLFGILLFAWPALANPASVILISIDTLRADHLSSYGYKKIQTPNLDSFAEGGTLFTSVNSQIPLTLPSHTSLFTSMYPFETHVEENDNRVPKGLVTLASVLRANGHKTAAFVGSILLDRRLGLDPGFDVYDSPFHTTPGAASNPYSMRVRRDGSLVLRAARQWLNENRGDSVFLFVHLFDLHTPYSTGSYDSEIQRVDQLLGRFKQTLVEGGWWDRSMVVLLSDHGESLGEHGESTHGYFIYQSTLAVPLLIHWPPGTGSHPARGTEPAGLIDVAPTILDALHIPAPTSFHGRNLTGPGGAVYSESLYTHDAFGWAALRSIRRGPFQYIEAPKPELYNLARDPQEHTNLLRQNPEEAQTLRAELRGILTRYAQVRATAHTSGSHEERDLLGSLGYISGSDTASANSGLDPKDRLPEYQLFEKGLGALYSGKLESARAAFRQIVAEDPHNALVRSNLGDCYLKLNKPEDALREWSAVLAGDPSYAPAAEAIAELWLARQDYAKARTFFAQVVASTPADFTAQFELGITDGRLGLLAEAREHLQAACNLDPESESCKHALDAVKSKLP